MERKKYNEEFRKNAVALLLEGELRASEIAQKLQIRTNLLYRWKQEYQSDLSGKIEKKIDPKDAEILRLKKELADVKMDRDILKKSVAIFSKL